MSDKEHKAIATIEQTAVAPASHPMAILQQAVASGADVETLERLMGLAERYEANEAKKAYDAAMIALKRDLPPVLGRDKTVDFRTAKGRVYYTHTSLAAVVDAVTETMSAHGFSHSWTADTNNNKVNVTCHISHSQGHSRSMTFGSAPDNSGSKSAAQGIASTMTLLQRYSLLAMLGIATADHTEPVGETDPGLVDTSINMRAVKAFIDAGFTKEDAEGLVSKPVKEWTAADLDVLRDWLTKRKAER